MKKTLILALSLIISTLSVAQTTKKFLKEGKTFKKEGKYAEAVTSFSNAIQLDPSLSQALIERAECHEQLNNFKDAIADYDAAIQLLPKETELWRTQGRIFARLQDHEKVIRNFSKILEKEKKDIEALQQITYAKIASKDFISASNTISIAIEHDNRNHVSYFYKALALDSLAEFQNAVNNYKMAISLIGVKKDQKIETIYKPYYTNLGTSQSKLNQADEAIKNYTIAIEIDPSDFQTYYLRSIPYFMKSDFTSAMNDLNKSITTNDKFYLSFFQRGLVYQALGQFTNAIGDFTKSIQLNQKYSLSFKGRGFCNDNLGNMELAIKDYESAIALAPLNLDLKNLLKGAIAKDFENKRETGLPEIQVTFPLPNDKGVINIPENLVHLELKGIIKDPSKIASITVQDIDAEFTKNTLNPKFAIKALVLNRPKINIVATDVYGNTGTLSVELKRTEIVPPSITIKTPFLSTEGELFVDNIEPNLFIEGKAEDDTLIKSILINGTSASFSLEERNPTFTATLANFNTIDTLKITATDINGNVSQYKYFVNRSTAIDLAKNPMGKTWVVFVQNGNYQNMQVLKGPEEDITLMRSALSNYHIDKILVKKDLSKGKLEKFLSIELRDMLKGAQVNSLVIWYAGHGKYLNETGYWIPVDANSNDEFTYFPIGNLKGYISSYKTIKHIMVISDACETGPAFYLTMRNNDKPRDCGDWMPAKFKSAQVFTSSNVEASSDNSIFTKTFATSLTSNPEGCISMEKIAEKVSRVVKENRKQTPKFGNINGIDQEGGAFFFIKKK